MLFLILRVLGSITYVRILLGKRRLYFYYYVTLPRSMRTYTAADKLIS